MTVEELLIRDEGLVLHAYEDSLGYQTIGVGRLIDRRRGGGITKDEALYLLRNDIARVERDLDDKLPWWRSLDGARQQVLACMCFQLGIGGLLEFVRTLQAVREGRFVAAASFMLESRWAAQTPGRAREMARLMREGA